MTEERERQQRFVTLMSNSSNEFEVDLKPIQKRLSVAENSSRLGNPFKYLY